MLCGILVTTTHYFLYNSGVLHYGSALAMDFYGAAYGFFANVGVALLISLFDRDPATYRFKMSDMDGDSGDPPRPWYRTPQALAVFSLVVMIILNVIYW